MLSFLNTQDLAIDLGNNNTLITDQCNLLLSQPTCLVIDESTNRIEAVGDKAYNMFEKVHHQLKPVKPLKGGVISDGESTKRMLKELVSRAAKTQWPANRFNHLISGIPFDTTSVEQRALRDALDQFSARQTFLMYEPLAAALGMGLNIQNPAGNMIVDIGGGITEVVVISLSGIAAFESTKVAGDAMDEAIRDFFRKEFNMAIGLKSAERLKINSGCVYQPLADAKKMVAITGKDLIEGIPMKRVISEATLCEVLNISFQQIEAAIQHTLEICPPELASDIFQEGIHVTGGNALLKGVQQRLSAKFELPVSIDINSLQSVSKGIAQVLSAPKKFQSVLF